MHSWDCGLWGGVWWAQQSIHTTLTATMTYQKVWLFRKQSHLCHVILSHFFQPRPPGVKWRAKLYTINISLSTPKLLRPKNSLNIPHCNWVVLPATASLSRKSEVLVPQHRKNPYINTSHCCFHYCKFSMQVGQRS